MTSVKRPLKLAISTCPNDTFLFHALLTRRVEIPGVSLEIELMDIEELNRGLVDARFDVAKASFHLALRKAEDLVVLPVGAALGYGVGPVLLAESSGRPEDFRHTAPRVLCPGELTTAHLLYRLFHPGPATIEQVLFSDIMPRLKNGTADLGVCIHEGRFTYHSWGLSLVEDLGETWETAERSPLPLGGLLARRAVPADILVALTRAMRESLSFALENREATIPTMRRHAQEMDDAVLFRHVDLYVNEWTMDLGLVGRDALMRLSRRAAEAGLLPRDRSLEVFHG